MPRSPQLRLAAVAPATARQRRSLLLLSLLLVASLAMLAVAGPARAATGWLPTIDLAHPEDGAANQPSVAVDGDGTVHAAWVRAASSGGPSLVQVAEKPRFGVWSTPVVISRNVAGDSGSRVNAAPRVAVRDGVVAVTWLQTSPTSTKSATEAAWAALRSADGRWDAAVQLSTPASDEQPAPADSPVAAVAHGTATVGWVDDDGRAIVSSDGRPGGAWSPATTIAPGREAISTGYLDLAAHADGALTLIWSDASVDDEQPTIYASQRPAGGTWDDAVALSDDARYSIFPRLAITPDGGAEAVWQTRIDEVSAYANNEIQHVRRDPVSGEWSAPAVLSPPGGDANNRGSAKFPDVTVGPDGVVDVAWVRSEGANADLIPDRIQVRTRATIGGEWSDLTEAWNGLRNPTLRKPRIVAGPDGQATVSVSAYTTDVGAASGPRTVQVLRREALGGEWGTAQSLATPRAGSSTAVSWEIPLVADAGGNVTLAWHQTDATGEVGVKSAEYRAEEPPVDPEPEPEPAPQPAPDPQPSPMPLPQPGPGVAPPPGETQPTVLRASPRWVARQQRSVVLRRGVRLRFVDGAARARGTLVVKHGERVLGRHKVRLTRTGKLDQRIRLSSRARQTVRRSTRAIRLTVRLTVGKQVATRTVTLR